jgi:hypothetical protein
VSGNRFWQRAAWLAWLAMLPGCLVLDGRDTLEIEPAGTIYNYRDAAEVYLRVNGSLDTFTVKVADTLVEGTFPANQTVRVPLPSGIADGTYRLVLRAHEGTLPRSVERTLVVDRKPPTWSVAPPPGRVTSGEPFTVNVTCSRPLVPSSVTPSSARVGYPYQPSLAPPVLSGDARTVSFTLPASLDVLGSVSVSLEVALAGSPYTQSFGFGPWYAPTVNVAVSQPPDGQATNGVITFSATATGAIPASAELLAGDNVIATLGAPPWSIPWDTRSTPEGTYPLSVRSQGIHFVGNFPEVTIDRTPPALVRCAPQYSAVDDVRASECVIVEFSEPVFGNGPDLLLSGISRGVWRSNDCYTPQWGQSRCVACPIGTAVDPTTLPAVQTVSLPPPQDRAGNLAGANTCPPMTLPPWRRPWGEGPLVAAQGTLAAGEIALQGYSSSLGESATLLAIPPAGGPTSGVVGLWSSSAPSPWTLGRTLNVEAQPASDLGNGIWTERAGNGPGHVYRIDNDPPGPLNRDPARDARNPSASLLEWGVDAVAWSEELPAGGRAICVKKRQSSFPTWYDEGGPPLSSSSAVADEPSVGPTYRGAFSGVANIFVAWVETAPGGLPQVRAALGDDRFTIPPVTTWVVFPQVANVDPSQAAGEPSAWLGDWLGDPAAVAWREGGKVLARHSQAAWAAVELNVGPENTARLPHFDRAAARPVVYWVETSAGEDQIWARQWDGSAWVLLPGPLNAGIPGAVRRLDVAAGAVLWVDDTGAVRFRAANF